MMRTVKVAPRSWVRGRHAAAGDGRRQRGVVLVQRREDGGAHVGEHATSARLCVTETVEESGQLPGETRR